MRLGAPVWPFPAHSTTPNAQSGIVLSVSKADANSLGRQEETMRDLVRRSTILLALAAMLSTSVAQATEIWKFDRMADQDQDEYVGDLVVGAQKVLRDAGKADDAEKVHHLFTDRDPESDISIGMGEFEISLAKARVADLQRVAKDRKALRIEVEHAVIVTLKHNDIVLPKSFMTVMNDFKAKFPPKKK